jgi:hypothetical protein
MDFRKVENWLHNLLLAKMVPRFFPGFQTADRQNVEIKILIVPWQRGIVVWSPRPPPEQKIPGSSPARV